MITNKNTTRNKRTTENEWNCSCCASTIQRMNQFFNAAQKQFEIQTQNEISNINFLAENCQPTHKNTVQFVYFVVRNVYFPHQKISFFLSFDKWQTPEKANWWISVCKLLTNNKQNTEKNQMKTIRKWINRKSQLFCVRFGWQREREREEINLCTNCFEVNYLMEFSVLSND